MIDIQRTFITALCSGRNSNIRLRATYQNTEKPEFQVEENFVLFIELKSYYCYLFKG